MHTHTVFSQLLQLLPRKEFETLAKAHHVGQKYRKTSRWEQFVTLASSQLCARQSLRDCVLNLEKQAPKLYHLGCRPMARSTFARINCEQPASFYEALFYRLYAQCQGRLGGHGFRFKNKLFSLDASVIALSLHLFPWAKWGKIHAGMKLHVALNHQGEIPYFATLTSLRTPEIKTAKPLTWPKGSIVVVDRAYMSFVWFRILEEQGCYFVTRPLCHVRFKVLERRQVDKAKGILCDQIVLCCGGHAQRQKPLPLRRIVYQDQQTKKRLVFITNHFGLCAKTIADCYKARWKIELFFKWLKQNLKIKSFLGRTENAVKTQVFSALCVQLLLACLKVKNAIDLSLQNILRIIQVNLFMPTDLLLLLGKPPPPNLQIQGVLL